MDCKLFDRLGRSIIPTREADVLYPRAVAILEDLRKLEDDVAMAGQTVTGELVVGASTIPGTYILPSIAAEFKKRYPGISFEVRINHTTQIASDIQSNNLLLGVIGARLPSRQIRYSHFADDELVLIAAADSSLPDRIDLATLTHQPFIFREAGSGTRKTVETQLLGKLGTMENLNIVAMLGSTAAVKEAVKANLGVSFLSIYAIRDELECGLLRRIEVQDLRMERSLYLATAARRTLPHHYVVFLDFLAGRETESNQRKG